MRIVQIVHHLAEYFKLSNNWQIQWHASNKDLQVSKNINKSLQVNAIHTNQALQVNAMPRSARKLHAKQHLLVHGMPIKLWAKMNDMPTKVCQSINAIVTKICHPMPGMQSKSLQVNHRQPSSARSASEGITQAKVYQSKAHLPRSASR